MICARCQTPNPEGAVYCEGCGRPLLRKTPSRKNSSRPFLLAAGGAVVLVLLFLLYRHFAPAPRVDPVRGPAGADAAVGVSVQPVEGSLTATYGDVFVRGDAGREIFRTTAAVFDGEWVALPVAGLLGAEDLAFQADGSVARPIAEGTWGTGNPVAFWKVESGYPPAALALAAWQPALPLDWHPARSADPPLQLEVDATRRAGAFECFPLPPEIRFPGLFVQAGAVVGWSFSEPFDQAYLWAGVRGTGPPPAISLERFFDVVSSECREGYYRRFLDSGSETGPAAELEALARGFRRAPLLAPEDLPPDLKPSAIVSRMDALASDLIRSGQGNEVVRILDDQTIRESADPLLAADAILALAEGQDYNRTMRRLEAIERDVFAVRGLMPQELSELKSRLYKDWLRKIIEKGDYYSGAVAFEEARRAFPDDPEMRLLGAEIAMSDNDPDRAREILESGDIPPPLRGWADRLTAQVDEELDEPQDIVISFDPGEGSINVEAVINGSFTQKFIVDTGATFTAIPSSTAVALGIKFDEGIPAKAVATASGVQVAYEVTLGSIQLDQFRVDNITAYVMDMPLLPEVGLLGLNFFDSFSAEIDRKNGLLRLRKR